MKSKIIGFLRSKAVQFYPKLTNRVSEQAYMKKMLDDYHLIECKSKDAPATKTPPQAVQGLWQAYGAMRAASIRGWFGIAATGVIGTGLFLYRLILSDQKKEIKTKQEKLTTLEEQNAVAEERLREKEAQIIDREKAVEISQKVLKQQASKDEELAKSYEKMTKQLKVADQYVFKICGNDENCLSDYITQKESVLAEDKNSPVEVNTISLK